MANRIKGITVEIGGDTTKLSKALEGVNKNIKNTQSQLKDVENTENRTTITISAVLHKLTLQPNQKILNKNEKITLKLYRARYPRRMKSKGQAAIRGYAVVALDYVLKPVSYFAFSQRLNRAISRMKKRETKIIMVNMKGGMVRINVANIYYIESQGHTLILHTILGDYETTGTMKEMEEKMQGMNFCRGNKGYLINLQHVDGIQDGCALIKGEQLVLSRARKKEFMEALTNYWGEVVK